ncbi:hypothetical protein AOLI_G00117520 [Acnodon oligacanthus]
MSGETTPQCGDLGKRSDRTRHLRFKPAANVRDTSHDPRAKQQTEPAELRQSHPTNPERRDRPLSREDSKLLETTKKGSVCRPSTQRRWCFNGVVARAVQEPPRDAERERRAAVSAARFDLAPLYRRARFDLADRAQSVSRPCSEKPLRERRHHAQEQPRRAELGLS